MSIINKALSYITDIPILGGLVSDLGTKTIGKIFGDSSAKDQYQRSMDLMDHQYGMNTSAYKNRYKWTMQDMAEAGLNPILAASGGFSVGNAPSVSLPTPGMPDYGGTPSLSSSALDIARLSETEASTQKKRAEREKLLEEIRKTMMETNLGLQKIMESRANQKLLTQNERESVQRIQLLQKQINQTLSATYKIEDERQEILQKIKTERNRQSLVKSQTEQYQKLTAKLQQEINQLIEALPQLRSKGNVYRTQVGQIITMMKEVAKAVPILNIPYMFKQ